MPVHNLKDLIAFNERHAAQEMPWFGQELFEQAQAKEPQSDKTYAVALLAKYQGIRRNRHRARWAGDR